MNTPADNFKHFFKDADDHKTRKVLDFHFLAGFPSRQILILSKYHLSAFQRINLLIRRR